MPVIAQTIATLDVPIPQVMLEVEMLDVSKKIVDKLGFNWSQAGTFSVTLVPATAGTWFPFGNLFHRDGGGPTRSTNNAAGKLSFSSFTLALDYLRTQTDTKYLARPRLLTLNNETAEIKIVTEESIGVKTTEVSTTGSTSAEPERAETGVLLRVTPQINSEAGEITMFIYPQVSEATTGQSIQTPDGNYLYRDPEIRSTKSMVRVKDGDTVIVGGLIRNEFTQTITKVPILGDIPIIGALFRSKGGSGTNFANDKDRERELLVFITPHIIKDTSMELAQAKKVPIPEREQSAVSVGDRQAAVATSLNNFEKKKK
jgi:type II secretory pathway component GspD/PulD (secretin)